MGTHIPRLPSPPPAMEDFQPEVPAWKALLPDPPTVPREEGFASDGSHQPTAPTRGRGSSVLPGCPVRVQRAFGSVQPPQLLVAGQSLTRPDGDGGLGRAPCPTQCLPSPRGKREAVPFQLTDSGKAGSPSRSVVSKPQSRDEQRQEGGVTPSVPSALVQQGREHVSWQRRQGGRQRAGARVQRHRQERDWRKAANEGTQCWRNGSIQAPAFTHKGLTQGHSANPTLDGGLSGRSHHQILICGSKRKLMA